MMYIVAVRHKADGTGKNHEWSVTGAAKYSGTGEPGVYLHLQHHGTYSYVVSLVGSDPDELHRIAYEFIKREQQIFEYTRQQLAGGETFGPKKIVSSRVEELEQ